MMRRRRAVCAKSKPNPWRCFVANRWALREPIMLAAISSIGSAVVMVPKHPRRTCGRRGEPCLKTDRQSAIAREKNRKRHVLPRDAFDCTSRYQNLAISSELLKALRASHLTEGDPRKLLVKGRPEFYTSAFQTTNPRTPTPIPFNRLLPPASSTTVLQN